MKQITSIIVFISITFLIYGLYNCNCNKNKSYEKFESNNNPTFLNIINKNMNNIQNISNFNKKLLKNITDSNFNFNLNLNKNTEKFIDTIKITTPDDISKLNEIIKEILSGKDADGNYDINNINQQLTNIKTQLDTFLNQQQTEHQTIINSINSSISTLGNTSNTLLLQKENISALQGNKTLFNDIPIITDEPLIIFNSNEAIITPSPTIPVNTEQPTMTPILNNQVNTPPSTIMTPSNNTVNTEQPIIMIPSNISVNTPLPTMTPILNNQVNMKEPVLNDSMVNMSSNETFENVNQPMPYNNKLILNNLLPFNKNIKQNIESHKIIIKQNKNLFNNLPKSIKMNDFERCQPNWQLEWAENLKQIKI